MEGHGVGGLRREGYVGYLFINLAGSCEVTDGNTTADQVGYADRECNVHNDEIHVDLRSDAGKCRYRGKPKEGSLEFRPRRHILSKAFHISRDIIQDSLKSLKQDDQTLVKQERVKPTDLAL